ISLWLNHVVRQNVGNAPSTVWIQHLVCQNQRVIGDPQTKCFCIEGNSQSSQTRRVYQRQHAVLSAPHIIRYIRIRKPYSENTITGDPAFVENRQTLAVFGGEPLYRIAV